MEYQWRMPLWLLLGILLAIPSSYGVAQEATPSKEFDCHIEFIDKPILAAHESGILVSVVDEGTIVEQDDEVAMVDNEVAKMRRIAAWHQFQANLKNSESDVRVRYARAQYDTSRAALRQVVEANALSPKAISQAELDRKALEVKSALLSIENAEHEAAVAKESVKKDEAEYKLATLLALRHSIKSPIRGMVVERLKQVGEYVQVGEQVIKIVRLNRLRAIGHMRADHLGPKDAVGRRVTILFNLKEDNRSVPGVVSFASPDVTMNEYEIWVDFDNFDDLAIRPGMDCKMRLD